MKTLFGQFVSVISLGGLCLFTACHRPAWEAAKDERMQKIDDKRCLIQNRETSRPERLEWMKKRIHRSHCYNVEHLESARALVHREWESDKTRWCEERCKRRAFARDQWYGNPEKIPDTWAKMVY
jgi:hypothetical protein